MSKKNKVERYGEPKYVQVHLKIEEDWNIDIVEVLIPINECQKQYCRSQHWRQAFAVLGVEFYNHLRKWLSWNFENIHFVLSREGIFFQPPKRRWHVQVELNPNIVLYLSDHVKSIQQKPISCWDNRPHRSFIWRNLVVAVSMYRMIDVVAVHWREVLAVGGSVNVTSIHSATTTIALLTSLEEYICCFQKMKLLRDLHICQSNQKGNSFLFLVSPSIFYSSNIKIIACFGSLEAVVNKDNGNWDNLHVICEIGHENKVWKMDSSDAQHCWHILSILIPWVFNLVTVPNAFEIILQRKCLIFGNIESFQILNLIYGFPWGGKIVLAASSSAIAIR